ncbi:PKD domain-containing protein [Ideonella paludis]|uniref:PKD domain-containing protein n=1 Tax=Ideonella paludis TaxID=1233411 RepID=UPI003628AF02
MKAVQPQSPVAGQSVSMAAQGEGSGLSYSWSFGDGATADGANVSHTFSQPGSYTATVTVKDSTGRSATATANITVSAPALTAVVTAASKEAAAGQSLSFTAQQLPQAGVTYRWSFGDAGKAEGLSVNHRFLVPGTYTVMLTTSNAEGQSATASVTVLVTGTGPAIGVGQDAAVAGLAYDLRVTGLSEPSGVDVAWDFGDGTGQLGAVATHTYVATGTYTARAQLYGSNGSIYDLTRTITVVSQGLPGELTLQIQGDSVTKVGSQATWRLNASAPLQAVEWSFGDGTQGYGEIASHAYAAAGDYTVTAKATDTAGRKTSTSTQISIRVELPTATITGFSPAAPRAGVAVQFNGTGTGDLAGAQAYEWHFGDGATATGSNPSHTYQSAGSYSVVLVARDRSGLASAPATATITVLPALPNAPSALVIKPSQLVLGVSAQVGFVGEAVGTGALTYQWQFGDGNVATGPQASHRYSRAGTFNVVMTVTDPEGQQSSASATLVVSPYQTLNLLAGNLGGRGFRDGVGDDARFINTVDIAQLSDGSFVVADTTTLRIMTPSGQVRTLMGQPYSSNRADGNLLSGSFGYISAVVVGRDDSIYVLDGCAIRKLTNFNELRTIAGSLDQCGDRDGVATDARFYAKDIAIDRSGNIYIADEHAEKIKKLSVDGTVTTIAGIGQNPVWSARPVEGVAKEIYIGRVYAVAVDLDDRLLYKTQRQFVMRLGEDGLVSMVHEPTTGDLNYSLDLSGRLAVGPDGAIYFSDLSSVKKVVSRTSATTIVGPTSPTEPVFDEPLGLTVVATGDILLADGPAVRKISGNALVSLAGSPATPSSGALLGFGLPRAGYLSGRIIGADAVGNVYSVARCIINGAPTELSSYRRRTPSGAFEMLYVGTGGGWRAHVEEDCAQSLVEFGPPGLVRATPSPSGDIYFVNDWFSSEIHKIDKFGQLTFIAGNRELFSPTAKDGVGRDAIITFVQSTTFNADGHLVIAGDGLIRKVTPDGKVETIVGVGDFAYRIVGVAAAPGGNYFFTSGNRHDVLKVDALKRVTVLAGDKDQSGLTDAVGALAKFSEPTDLALDSKGNLYVSDFVNQAVRRVDPAGRVVTVIGGKLYSGNQLGALPALISRPEELFVTPDDQLLLQSEGAVFITGGL